jgi:hypothetical protein
MCKEFPDSNILEQALMNLWAEGAKGFKRLRPGYPA